MDKKEKFITKSEEEMGKHLNIVKNEEKIITKKSKKV